MYHAYCIYFYGWQVDMLLYISQLFGTYSEIPLKEKYAPGHSSPDSRLWCNVFTRWTQNNQTKLNTREYFERYLTKIYPKESYFVIMERSEWSSRGLFLSFRLRTHRIAPNVTLFLQTFFHTLQNIPHSFFKYTNQIIYAPEHPQYITQHMVSLMSGTTVDGYILNPSMNVMVACPQLQQGEVSSLLSGFLCIRKHVN